VASRALGSALRLGFALFLWDRGVDDAALFLLVASIGSGIGNIVLHLASRSQLPKLAGTPSSTRALLRRALPLGIAGLCQQTYFWADNAFVRVLEGDAWLGRYNACARLLSFMIMAALMAASSAAPWLARRHRAGDVGVATARLSQPLLALAGLGAGLLWSSSGRLLSILFGEGYEVAGPAMQWLLLAVVAVYAGAPFLTAVVAMGGTGSVLGVAASALAVNIAGNALLIPILGIEGAALATLATEISVAGGALLVLGRRGIHPLAERPWAWAGGPLGFALGLALALPLASA